MASHVTVFYQSVDGAGALAALNALSDPYVQLFQPVGTTYLRVPGEFTGLAGAYCVVDATVQPRARVVAPSLRDTYGRTGIELSSLASTQIPLATQLPFNDFRRDPIRLRPSESLSIETLNDPASAAKQYAVLFMSNGPVQAIDPVGGYWVRFITAASAMTANTWNNRTLSSDETLAPGKYDVLGLRAFSTTGLAVRLAFTGQVNRPGATCSPTRASVPADAFLPGAWGVLGTFDTDTLPSADFLVNAADNEVQVVDLYVRRTTKK